jgi:DNA-binding XRE family transcriptional regulator
MCPADSRVQNRIRLLRTEHGWSQGELAERLRVSRQTVNSIETDRYDPSLPLAFTISRLFRLPIEQIFTLERGDKNKWQHPWSSSHQVQLLLPMPGFDALYEMSPYHQVRDGTPYPAVLLSTGINDPRVDSWELVKLTARLQAATSSGKPILLRVDYEAGHGIGSTKTQTQQLRADQFSFLFWQLGAQDFQPSRWGTLSKKTCASATNIRCRFSSRLTPTSSGIAKVELRQITLSVNDLTISGSTHGRAFRPYSWRWRLTKVKKLQTAMFGICEDLAQ